jgi:hypothetical protein
MVDLIFAEGLMMWCSKCVKVGEVGRCWGNWVAGGGFRADRWGMGWSVGAYCIAMMGVSIMARGETLMRKMDWKEKRF